MFVFSLCKIIPFLFWQRKTVFKSWYPDTKQHPSLQITITYLPQSIWHHHHCCYNLYRHHCCCTCRHHHHQWTHLDYVLATKSLIWVMSQSFRIDKTPLAGIFEQGIKPFVSFWLSGSESEEIGTVSSTSIATIFSTSHKSMPSENQTYLLECDAKQIEISSSIVF